jgi:hypothetical protein
MQSTMKYLSLLFTVFFFQGLPYKPKAEFDIQLDYKFKARPAESSTTLLAESQIGNNNKTSSALLPYLILNVKINKLNNEMRLRISNNLNTKFQTRKVAEGTIFPINMGFTADVKDRVAPHEYVLTFLSPEKSETSRIVIHVEEDGSFIVNGEKRGRF